MWRHRYAVAARPVLARRGWPCWRVQRGWLTAALLAPTLWAGGLAAQERILAGVVLEEGTLRPLAGAQVLMQGTAQGVLTDGSGRFRLEVAQPVGTAVEVQVVILGFQTATLPARVGATNLRFVLTQAAIALDAVVVTGTAGATQKRAIGNVVAQVQASKVVSVAAISDMQQLLHGRAPGVVVLPGSGNVGTGSTTRVRGVSSLSLSNEPLIYVDGVRLNNNPGAGPNIRQGRQVNRLNDINPEDVESIEIIKGPAAATLYGTEASTGVIQIITKRGRSGRPQFEVVVKQGVNFIADLDSKLPVVYGRDPASGQVLSVNLYEQEKAAGRDAFQYGPVQYYGGNLSGGTDQIRYYMSVDYENTEGAVSYNWQKRLNTRANISLLLSERLDVASNLGFVTARSRLAQAAAGWGVWDQFVWGSPLTVSTRTRGFLRAPPEVAAEIEALTDIDRFIGGVQLNYRPFGWLAHRLSAGLDNGDETNSILFPRHPGGSSYFFGGLSLGQKTVERRKSIYTTLDYSATASLNLTPAIGFATSVGAQYYTKRLENVDALGQQFPAPSVESVGGAAVTFGSEDIVENNTFGLFVQEQISLNNRLFLTAAVRGDDNSAFGENFDVVIYPKVSASWVISEEPFWKFTPVNTLKLRGAWGRAGQQPDVFAAARLYSPATGPGNASVLTPQTVDNPDLAPEVGEELEVGFDAALFDDRIGLTVTYYDQRTRDAIVQRGVAPSRGFPGVQFVNLGELSNRGAEIGVDAQVVRVNRLSWDLGFKVSTNKSEVIDLGGLPPIAFGAEQEHREGFPIGAIFYRRVVQADLDANGRAINVLCDGGSENAGQPVPCDEAPRVYWGPTAPTWEGAVTTTLTLFDRIQLYGLVDFRGGHWFQNGDINASHTTFRNSAAIHEAKDPILLAYDQLGLTSATGFLKGGFAKLRELSGTYTLPEQLSRRFGASRASITVAGRNLATLWVAQEDVFGHPVPDPEVRTPSSNLSSYVQTVLPPLSQILATMRVSF